MNKIELKYAPHKCRYFCCGDCAISGRTCISDYPECRAAEDKNKPFTNLDDIRSKSADEMVAFLRKTTCRDICAIYEKANGENCDCNKGIKEWLLRKRKDN